MAEGLQRVAIRGVDFPVVADRARLLLRVQPHVANVRALDAPRAPFSRSERKRSGESRFEVGMSYSYADLNQVNRDDLGEIIGTGPSGIALQLGQPTTSGVALDSRIDFNDFSIKHHWFNLSFTYGLTERWDVNVLLPLVQTEARRSGPPAIRADSLLLDDPSQCSASTFVDLGSTSTSTVKASGTAFGVGDLLARTKYRVVEGPVTSLRF